MDEAKRCAKVLEQGERTADGKPVFFIRVANECGQEIDVKVCFEDETIGADCQQRSIPGEGTMTYTRSLEYLGSGIRLFVRFTDEARVCRFPISTDVRFD